MKIILQPGRDRSVHLHHPWIFSSAVRTVEGSPRPGDTVDVVSASGEWLARAAYSPASRIVARVWTWLPDECVDDAFFARRVKAAIDLRRMVIPPAETNAMRLVHAESDGLPGLVVDRYADVLVMQVLSAGVERWREVLAGALQTASEAGKVYERSDVDVRRLEGLPERSGPVLGGELDDALVVTENCLKFGVDVRAGQKTGFYLDQRRNRKRIGELANGKRVLNCFSYTGAFTVYALAGGAESVLSVDTSADALEQGRRNLALNHLPDERAEWLEGDVFHVLRTMRDRGDQYDLIILDPPKFAPTVAQAERAARGYKDINLLAFKLLSPGGILATFSCSGGVSAELFQKIVTGAAQDAGVDARLLEKMEQGPDHPVALNFPEGAYLKGLVCQV